MAPAAAAVDAAHLDAEPAGRVGPGESARAPAVCAVARRVHEVATHTEAARGVLPSAHLARVAGALALGER